ncbi:adenylyl-sulfate kinase, partial [Candidatus Woesearchaeota archaeon]|nr:adenylyl-sulfate kinase [Candidatus Woesearchaeota archaeon]
PLSWFNGNNILTSLDCFEKEKSLTQKPFRMPVQDIYKFTSNGDDRRIIAGRVESGKINVGDEVVFLPSNKTSRIKSVESFNTEKRLTAKAGQAIGFTLEEQIYISRGDVMSKTSEISPQASTMLKTSIFWMGRSALTKDKEYKLKIGTSSVPVKVKQILKVLNASNLSNEVKDSVERHEVCECVLETLKPIAFDLSHNLETTSRFVIVDEYDISGGGIIIENVEESHKTKTIKSKNIVWHNSEIKKENRTAITGHGSGVLWLTGLSGSGKSTIANALQNKLHSEGKMTYILDGDNVRHGLNADLGFSPAHRIENVRRVGEVSKLFNDAGIITIASFISPYQEDRDNVRKSIGDDFHEIHIDCDVNECEKRDPKGLYKKARSGEIPNFTGISAPYEFPKNPELVVNTSKNSVEECVEIIYNYLVKKGII